MSKSFFGRTKLASRRKIFACLVVSSAIGLASLMFATLSTKGLTVLELFMIICFVFTLPWLVIGFWNAVIGLLIMRFSKNPVSKVNPILENYDPVVPIECSTAVISCIRNEDHRMVERNLNGILMELDRKGFSGKDRFTFYILSDSTEQDIIEGEETIVADLKTRWKQSFEIVYRRRESNSGFKAGNIRDFCDNWGHLHDHMLVLDADSYMSADCILKLAGLMQENPQIGILQSLVVGMPATSPFARVFQYGMRLGMKSYTIGSAWWQGDCGPYWGHNAIIRIKPFISDCELPELSGDGPLSGSILSHDQLEATFMRRAGYEVRVVPEEGGSYEENPTSMPEFIRRDLRWCQGNLQYLKLLGTKGLKPISRIQLLLAILMFIGSPAWLLFMMTGAVAVMLYGRVPIMFDDTLVSGTLEDKELLGAMLTYDSFNHYYGILTIMVIMAMVFAPKIATVIDILSRKQMRREYGGTGNILISTGIEIVFSALLAPIMAVAHTVFMGGLLFGKKIVWTPPKRNESNISHWSALKRLWPQTLLGILGLGFMAFHSSGAVLFALPVILGLIVSVPFAVTSASSKFSKWFTRSGLWSIPEERLNTACLTPLNLPALANQMENSAEQQNSASAALPIVPTDQVTENA